MARVPKTVKAVNNAISSLKNKIKALEKRKNMLAKKIKKSIVKKSVVKKSPVKKKAAKKKR